MKEKCEFYENFTKTLAEILYLNLQESHLGRNK